MNPRHRAAVRALPAGRARPGEEQRLETLQKRLTKTEAEVVKLTAQRDELAMRMWLTGTPQAEIAERLDRSDRNAGGEGISYAAIQKRMWRRAAQAG